MRVAFAIVLVVHGLIHLLGFAKAFEFAVLPQLTRPIPPSTGVLWLTAALLFLLTAGALFTWPRWWWAIGAVAVAWSMMAVAPSWADAKFGALANLIAVIGIVFGFLSQGPISLRAEYDRDVDRGVARVGPAEPISVMDLAHLPAPEAQYLRATRVVGQPRIRNFRARLHGRIRSSRDARWIPLTAEQFNLSTNQRACAT
jgi:hypothetical protein